MTAPLERRIVRALSDTDGVPFQQLDERFADVDPGELVDALTDLVDAGRVTFTPPDDDAMAGEYSLSDVRTDDDQGGLTGGERSGVTYDVLQADTGRGRGRQALVRLGEPVRVTQLEEPVETAHFVVSTAVDPLRGPETFVFPATEGGEILEPTRLPGSFRGALDHQRAIDGFVDWVADRDDSTAAEPPDDGTESGEESTTDAAPVAAKLEAVATDPVGVLPEDPSAIGRLPTTIVDDIRAAPRAEAASVADELDLTAIAFAFALEPITYDPDAFPALFYRLDDESLDARTTVVVLETGVLVAFGQSRDDVVESIETVRGRLDAVELI